MDFPPNLYVQELDIVWKLGKCLYNEAVILFRV